MLSFRLSVLSVSARPFTRSRFRDLGVGASLAVAALLACAVAISPLSAAAALPAEPGPILIAGQNDAGWTALFAKLATPGTVFSKFTESRWFPVRKQPVVLQGEMRLVPERGLSLHYPPPENRTLIVDAKGLLLRDEKGRNRELPSDARASAVASALLPVLKFDRVELEKSFELHGVRDGTAWRIDLVPRTPALLKTLGRISIAGDNQQVQRLEFRRSDKQRVEIVITESKSDATFSPEELKRFFR